MPTSAAIPLPVRFAPFRGSSVVAQGLVTPRQLRGGQWRRLFRDVYVAADAEVDHLTLCQAATLLLPPGAALSHRCAAMLYGADILGRDQPVEVTAPPAAGVRSQPGLLVVRSPLPPDEVGRRCGLPVTSPLRTAFDLARGPDLVEAVAGVDALLYQRAVNPEAAAEFVRRHAYWNGARRARQALALARPRVESVLKSRLRLGIVLAGLPEPVVQHDVFDTSGRFVARLDLAYRGVRVGLEYDGDRRERAAVRHDAVRLDRLRLLGWTVLRCTADDVLRNPDRMIAQLRAALSC